MISFQVVFRDDWLMRMVEQIAAVIAKITGLSRNKDYGAALAEAEKGWDILGVPRDLVAVLDGPTLAELLATPEKMRAAADLLIAEAVALTGKGDPIHAAICYRRGFELYLEARAIAPLPSDDETLRGLSRHVPAHLVDPRYR
ncbi:MAG TPA: hypothetical protein VGO00_10420 [Kofleriaceae bacterium]|nr:hypothetical protein [Kofleriaceae bacterium]